LKKSSKAATTTKKVVGTKVTRSKSKQEKVKPITEETKLQKAKKEKVQETGDKNLKDAKVTMKLEVQKPEFQAAHKTPKKVEEEEAIKKSMIKAKKTPPLKKRLRTKTVNAQKNVVDTKTASKNGSVKVASKKAAQSDKVEEKQTRKRGAAGDKKKPTTVVTKKSKTTIKDEKDDLPPRRSTRRKN